MFSVSCTMSATGSTTPCLQVSARWQTKKVERGDSKRKRSSEEKGNKMMLQSSRSLQFVCVSVRHGAATKQTSYINNINNIININNSINNINNNINNSINNKTRT